MRLLIKRDGKLLTKSFKKLSPNELRSVANNTRFRILNYLKNEPTYPNALAKKLGINEQKVYYHINELKNSGVIKVVRSEEIKGSIANFYGVTADSFGVELNGDYDEIIINESNPLLNEFFKEFNNNGFFDGLIVVGSPLPHGPFKAVARDGHYAAQLGLILGSLFKINDFVVRLDTDVINENKLNENLIIIGGPGTNLVAARINKYLKKRFNEDNYWLSINGLQSYTDDACGLVSKAINPFNKDKVIVLLAGLRAVGTKSAIISLMNNELLSNYKSMPFQKIIKGFDLSGDGRVDSVEVLE